MSLRVCNISFPKMPNEVSRDIFWLFFFQLLLIFLLVLSLYTTHNFPPLHPFSWLKAKASITWDVNCSRQCAEIIWFEGSDQLASKEKCKGHQWISALWRAKCPDAASSEPLASLLALVASHHFRSRLLLINEVMFLQCSHKQSKQHCLTVSEPGITTLLSRMKQGILTLPFPLSYMAPRESSANL